MTSDVKYTVAKMTFFSRHRLLLLTIACFAIAVGILQSNNERNIVEPDSQAFIRELHEKEIMAEQLVDTLLRYASAGEMDSYVNSKYADRLYDRNGIVLYVYTSNRLTYWSNNSIAIPNGSQWFRKPFLHTGNAYVVTRYQTQGKHTAVAAIVVKNEYPYENNFLHNNLHHSFGIKGRLDIVDDNPQAENTAYGNDGKYLFTYELTAADKDSSIAVFPLIAIAALLLLFYVQRGIKKNRLTNRKFLIIMVIVVVIRIVMQIFLHDRIASIPIFSPHYFASSVVFPSIGDMLITIVLVVYLLFVYYYKVHLQKLDTFGWPRRVTVSVVWIVALMGYFYGMCYIQRILIYDSNLQFEIFEITTLNVYSFVAYLISVMSLVGFMFMLDKAAIQMLKGYRLFHALFYLLVCMAVAVAVILRYNNNADNVLMCVSFGVLSVLWFYLRSTRHVNYATFALFIALYTVFLTSYIHIHSSIRHDAECEVMAVNLSQVNDPAAEIIIADVIDGIRTDGNVADMLSDDEYNIDNLRRYLHSTYFNGYLNRYNFELAVCNSRDVMSADIDREQSNCQQYYARYLRRYGSQTQVQGLYTISDAKSDVNYFIRMTIALSGQRFTTIFLSLSPKLNYEVLGYPELLLDKPLYSNKYQQQVSYAKYQNNRLILQSGTFPYAFDNHIYGNFNSELNHFQTDRYNHTLYNCDDENCIIVSTPKTTMFSILISFTYTFVFFILILTILLILSNPYTKIFSIKFSIKNKILLSTMLILVLSLIAVTGGIIYYTINHFQRGQNDIMTNRVQSVLMELEQRYSGISNIRRIPANELNNTLASLANIFLTDINLYDQNGHLLATSRHEIYSRKLTSEMMNASAYRELIVNRKARVVQKENIGELEYYSAYVPFINGNNRLLAYINLPYFIKQAPLEQEITSVTVTMVNIYMALVLISIIIALFLSGRITEPLIDVTRKIRDIDIGKNNNQRVEYSGDDEIAELVKEYNLMLEQLSISATQLAKSERESAWREMARQVAHEIKNPLTPMKLSVQLLERSHRNGDPDFAERFANTAATLIEQIDSMASIATEFSQFARMPEGRTEVVDLAERINQSVELFRDTTNIKITFTAPAGRAVHIIADNERMLQVFNNLIKNAIQAIPKKRKGQIVITLRCMRGRAVVEVQDNGTGISAESEDKLFQPNFTTKTSGTGLGLAIVKNIIEEAGGAIWFYSKPGKGSSFFVSFPLNDKL